MTIDNYLAPDEVYVAYQGDKYLARILGYQTRTIRKYVKEGKLPGFFMGHDCVVTKEQINELIAGDFVPQRKEDRHAGHQVGQEVATQINTMHELERTNFLKRRSKAA